MTQTPTARTAQEKRRDDRVALRIKLLAELLGKPRTTMQLAVMLEVDRQAVYQAMQALEKEGQVTSFHDRRKTVTGTPGLVWSLADTKPAPPPARDPLMQALFGSPP